MLVWGYSGCGLGYLTYGAAGGSGALDGLGWGTMRSATSLALFSRGLAVTLNDARKERRM